MALQLFPAALHGLDLPLGLVVAVFVLHTCKATSWLTRSTRLTAGGVYGRFFIGPSSGKIPSQQLNGC
jgi:hypothetical protein